MIASFLLVALVLQGVGLVSKKSFQRGVILQIVQVPGKTMNVQQFVVRVEGKRRVIGSSDLYVRGGVGAQVCVQTTETLFGRKRFSISPIGFCPDFGGAQSEPSLSGARPLP